MANPEFWLVAGPNGAGKTTLVQAEPISKLLPHVSFINPDDLALKLIKEAGWRNFAEAPEDVKQAAFIAAAEESFGQVLKGVAAKAATGIETVLSTDKYLPLAKNIVSAGGFFGLIYVWVNTAELACRRVARRVVQGGHDVAQAKVVSRWQRSLERAGVFAQIASEFWVFDNSDSDPAKAPILIARGGQGRLDYMHLSISPQLQGAFSRLSRPR